MAKQVGNIFLWKIISGQQKTGTRWLCAGFLPFQINHGR